MGHYCRAALPALLAAVTGAHAQTFSFTTQVVSANGRHAALFSPGEAITVAYGLDPAAVDGNPDPRRGSYQDSVLSLVVVFPELGLRFEYGPAGTAQTFNDVGTAPENLSDQVFLFGGAPISVDAVAGESVESFEIDYIDTTSDASAPTMLDSDAIPSRYLVAREAFVFFSTSGGSTSVRFSIPPSVDCAVSLSQTSYADGDMLIVESMRLRNLTSSPRTVEWKSWLRLGPFAEVSLVNLGASGELSLPPLLDLELGPLALGIVSPAFPRGHHGLGCRLLSPVTGESIASDFSDFEAVGVKVVVARIVTRVRDACWVPFVAGAACSAG